MSTLTSHTEKIAKLLAQAEGAGTEAEAQTFLAKAQELSTLYSIDLAKARHLNVAKERTAPIQRTITLGVRGTRGLNTLINLFNGIASANDVTINIAHNSTYVVAFGFEEDIDTAEALYSSLVVQMSQAVAAYRKEGSWKDLTVWRPGRYKKVQVGPSVWDTDWEYVEADYVPITWLSARLDFQEGYGDRIALRLRLAKSEAEQAAKDAEAADEVSTGTELVLVEKRAQVSDFYKKHSTARGSYRGGRSVASSSASRAGAHAADNAKLSKSTSLSGARKAIA